MNFITREGWQELDKELKFLWKTKRPAVTQAVSDAAALGDRSENAEYKEGKRQLREIDRRLQFLIKRLDILQIVDHVPTQNGKVFFGAWVTLENETKEQVKYRIVGTDEFNPKQGLISVKSPMAQALLGKEVDDEIIVKTPDGDKTWYISDIEYLKED